MAVNNPTSAARGRRKAEKLEERERKKERVREKRMKGVGETRRKLTMSSLTEIETINFRYANILGKFPLPDNLW